MAAGEGGSGRGAAAAALVAVVKVVASVTVGQAVGKGVPSRLQTRRADGRAGGWAAGGGDAVYECRASAGRLWQRFAIPKSVFACAATASQRACATFRTWRLPLRNWLAPPANVRTWIDPADLVDGHIIAPGGLKVVAHCSLISFGSERVACALDVVPNAVFALLPAYMLGRSVAGRPESCLRLFEQPEARKPMGRNGLTSTRGYHYPPNVAAPAGFAQFGAASSDIESLPGC